MRSTLLLLGAAVLVACADDPASPLLEPGGPRFGGFEDDPPPPWAMVKGEVATGTGEASYTANFLVVPPGNVAWLNFTGGTGATFSANARISSVNGDVRGTGTMTVGGTTYQLSSVSSFTYDASCTVSPTTSCASFSGTGFSSGGSTWTGQLAGGGRGRDRWDGGKPGRGNDPPEACIPDDTGECGIIFKP